MIDAIRSARLAGITVLLYLIGHVLGAILRGLALRGSIVTLGWVSMVVSQPAHA